MLCFYSHDPPSKQVCVRVLEVLGLKKSVQSGSVDEGQPRPGGCPYDGHPGGSDSF